MIYSFYRYRRIPSTNDIARAMAGRGASEGTVVVAETQSAGRGRPGRDWVSPPGTGLYLSVVLRPKASMGDFWQTAFVMAVSAADAIYEATGLDVQLKWPNDVLINERKACGILIETFIGDEKGSPAVIAGIGINVNTLEFPPEIAHKATSITMELGGPIEVGSIESSLLSSVNKWYTLYNEEGFDPIISRWRELDCTYGRHISVDTPDGLEEGTALGVEDDGSLLIRRPDGTRIPIHAGETIWRMCR
ncbi:MAG: biotin--[acetyl-CoA-carboxylase] ligase [Armatimonadota bacterium]